MTVTEIAEEVHALASKAGGGELSMAYWPHSHKPWMATCAVLPHRTRNRWARAHGETPEQALKALWGLVVERTAS